MISLPLKPFLRMKALMWMVRTLLVVWAVTATVWAYQMRPQTILIGLDEVGTRVITSVEDPILVKERVHFIREFLRGFYNYSSSDYSQVISQAGTLMSDVLWKEKEKEFEGLVKRMKETPLTQEARLLDLREVSEQEFEADLALRVRSRLQEKEVRYRVVLNVGPRKRSLENPYPWEVVAIHESQIN